MYTDSPLPRAVDSSPSNLLGRERKTLVVDNLVICHTHHRSVSMLRGIVKEQWKCIRGIMQMQWKYLCNLAL